MAFGASRVKRVFQAQTVVAISLPKIRACAGMTSLIISKTKPLQPPSNERESSMNYKVALIPGDGIGKEVVPGSVRTLKALSQKFGFGVTSPTSIS